MNKIYRVIWNAIQQAWGVVSELTKGHVKSSGGRRSNSEVTETFPKPTELYAIGQATAGTVMLCGVLRYHHNFNHSNG